MFLLPWLLALAQSASTVAPLEPSTLQLARIRARMRDNLTQLPNYTCTQTIERSQRRAKGRRFLLVDTIRLEVALVEGKELFAWPGAGRFDDRELRELIGNGASGNGSFALHARAVFLGGGARFEWQGETEESGRRLLKYSYRVPRLLSGFKLKVGDAEGISGFHGEFLADAETLDLVALDVIAEDIPPQVPLSGASDRMRYARVKIGERDFLLPESSEMTLLDTFGTESRNRVTFAGCRQYSGESVISFGDAPAPTEDPPPPPGIVDLPPDLILDIALSTPLRFPGAAIGDQFEGRLDSDARRKGKVMVPKGAIVHGRVVAAKPWPGARMPTMAITLQLTDVQLPNARAEIRGRIDNVANNAFGGGTRIAVDKQGILYISGNRHELMRGMRMWWRIEPKEVEHK